MDTGVVVAVITSVSSLFVAALTAFYASKQSRENRTAQKLLSDQQTAAEKEVAVLKHRLEREATEEDRRVEEGLRLRAEMARYRLPLLDAANDLRHRLQNIQKDHFLAYLAADHPRRDTAVLSTVYRLARYFGTLELLYRRVNFLRFQRDDETRAVAEAVAEIGRTFASDRYDREGAFHTSRFMVWREEQRAMGEVVTHADNSEADNCVGFATFVANARTRDSEWFGNFIADLEAGGAERSTRLAKVQSSLAGLVRMLDEEGRYSGSRAAPDWREAGPTQQ